VGNSPDSPFAVFAANGVDRLGLLQRRRQRAFGLLLVSFIVLGLGYSTGAFSYMGLYGVGSYAPGTMVQSSIATSDIDDAFGALRWLNQETPAAPACSATRGSSRLLSSP